MPHRGVDKALDQHLTSLAGDFQSRLLIGPTENAEGR